MKQDYIPNSGHVEKLIYNDVSKTISINICERAESSKVVAKTIREIAPKVGVGPNRFFVLTAPTKGADLGVLSLQSSIYDVAHFVGHVRNKTQLQELMKFGAPEILIDALKNLKTVLSGVTIYGMHHRDDTPIVIDFIDAATFINMHSKLYDSIDDSEIALDNESAMVVINEETDSFSKLIGDVPVITDMEVGSELIKIQVTVSKLSALDDIVLNEVFASIQNKSVFAPSDIHILANRHAENIRDRITVKKTRKRRGRAKG